MIPFAIFSIMLLDGAGDRSKKPGFPEADGGFWLRLLKNSIFGISCEIYCAPVGFMYH